MRRKLIKQDAFDRIISESVNAAERELVEVELILAKAVGKNCLRLKSFTESTVLYESEDGGYIHAGFEVKNGQITLNNIEELIIDENSQKEKRKSILSEMIDAVVVDRSDKANELFGNYLGIVRWNEAKEGKLPEFLKKKWNKDKDEDKDEDEDDSDMKKKNHKKGEKMPNFLKKGKKNNKEKNKEKKEEMSKKAKKAGKDVCEAYKTSQNVLDYVEFMKVGPEIAESITKVDDKGNLTDIRIPALNSRNENQLIRSEWKILNSKVADYRKKIPNLCENQNFCKAIAQLKRQNSFSDSQGLEESLDQIVNSWPEVLYATQGEISQVFNEALQTSGVKNFDDSTCDFMAEGILRKAHASYSEKVAQILHLASASKMEEGADAYSFFQKVVENFYPSLDEKFGLERKVFNDLYESLGFVYKKADRRGDKNLKNETSSYLNELAAVLNNEAKPDLQLAEEAAEFLSYIIETNLESGMWNVPNSPHESMNGDHPDMAKKAAHSYTPSKDFSGDYGDPSPAIGSDDMKYNSGKNSKQLRDKAWGQEGGNDVFPSLNNPYIPKSFGNYTMKGEKGVDKEKGDFSADSKDTFPKLNNPYVPQAKGTKKIMENINH